MASRLTYHQPEYSPAADAESAHVVAKTADLPNLEQFVAIFPDLDAVVAKKAVGTKLSLPPEEVCADISDQQIMDLLHTTVTAKNRGIFLDPSADNAFYCTAVGFTVIDCSTKDNGIDPSGMDYYSITEQSVTAPDP